MELDGNGTVAVQSPAIFACGIAVANADQNLSGASQKLLAGRSIIYATSFDQIVLKKDCWVG